MNEPLRAVIVGAGLMGQWHARYGARTGARVVAVVDRDAAAAERLARRFGARPAHAEEDWLALSEPDFVHVCTPPSSHFATSAAALEHGAHVIVEKPVADTLADTTKLAALAEAKQRLLVPVHQFPFQSGFRELRRRLPELGALRSVELVTFSAGAERRTGAARRQVALEILPHAVALFRALGCDIDVKQLIVDRFSDDALELTWQIGATRWSVRIDLCARPTCNELRVVGAQGTAAADLFHGYATIDRASTSRLSKALRPFRASGRLALAAGTNLAGRALRREPAYPGLRELIGASYAAARSGGPPPIAAREYLVAAELNQRLAADAHAVIADEAAC